MYLQSKKASRTATHGRCGGTWESACWVQVVLSGPCWHCLCLLGEGEFVGIFQENHVNWDRFSQKQLAQIFLCDLESVCHGRGLPGPSWQLGVPKVNLQCSIVPLTPGCRTASSPGQLSLYLCCGATATVNKHCIFLPSFLPGPLPSW